MTVTAKVLVCDDDTLNLEIVRELLQNDYEVASVESGEACLAKLSEFQPDVLLLDIMMPGLDGYETCRRIVAAANRSIPQIIFVSARTSTEERLAGYKAGADDFICKPFDHDELRAKVRVHAQLRCTIKELEQARGLMRRTITELEQARGQIVAHSCILERIVDERTAELRTAKERLADFARELSESNCRLVLIRSPSF